MPDSPFSVRLSPRTREQLEELAKQYKNRAEIIAIAIDRMWREEGRPMETYMLMDIGGSGETYALAWQGDRITGVFGPLGHDEIEGLELEYLDYNRDEDVAWANAQSWRIHA